MKKLFFLFAACTLSLAATAQTMNIHLKDGSTVQYTSSAVDYVDFTAAASNSANDVWSLVSDSVTFTESYGSMPGFMCSLYKNSDGSKYAFRNFAIDNDIEFTISSDSVKSSDGYFLGNYIYPTGGVYSGNYWYFTDSLWNAGYPLTWKTWPAHSLDGFGICVNTTYTTIDLEARTGWLCVYATPYTGATKGTAGWYYLYFSWPESVSSSASELTLADIAGTYTEHSTGYWQGNVDYSYDVTIEVVDEATNTIVLKGFSSSEQDLTGVVDLSAKTITFTANQTFYTWYTFSAETSIDTPVVATIADNGTISINGWSPWYGGYAYSSGMTSTLTKK
jgi:hypothetical protein